MKLDSLLKEYRDQISPAPVVDFEALLNQDAASTRQRKVMTFVGLAIAASLAGFLFFPATSATPSTPIAQLAANVGTLYDPPKVVTPAPLRERRLPKRRVQQREMLTGFVALAETRMLPEPRLLQLLRVNVSGDRLAALGVLAPNQAVSPRMTAEVLVGDDGMARAVRVVANE